MSFNLVSRSTALDAVRGDGLQLITSASFSTGSTVSVDNCFSSKYDRYEVVGSLTLSTAANACYVRMRAGGTDNTGATAYSWVQNYTVGTTLTGQTGDSKGGFVSTSNVTATGFRALFLSPALAAATQIWVAYSYVSTGSTIESGYYSTVHTVATAYDGFTIYPFTGTITGSLSVYGYRNS